MYDFTIHLVDSYGKSIEKIPYHTSPSEWEAGSASFHHHLLRAQATFKGESKISFRTIAASVGEGRGWKPSHFKEGSQVGIIPSS